MAIRGETTQQAVRKGARPATPHGKVAIVPEARVARFSQLQDMDRKCFVLLEDKTVVVYGVTSAHSAAMVRAFAGQRALIFFADSSYDRAEASARQLIDAGAVAEAAEVDLSDRRQFEEYTAELVEWTGGIDVAVVALRDHGTDAQLTAARTIAERMAAQGSGIIVITPAADGSEQEYRELAEHAAAHGVAVLPIFCAIDQGRNLSATIDYPILS
ncbi:SDR family NAD(P)-dependent oxidoreductase [Streptomyces sp. HK10]|uniref:SDR family NAD(P)-dependent oxidoreductase n=1 Tax=Streptomyces sp. HK10 TaxID=3373255 RepID=UPI003748E154